MRRRLLLVIVALLLGTEPAWAEEQGAPAVDGLVSLKSHHDVKTTIDRLQAVLTKQGITIVARWPHDARARDVGIDLRPTELLIFGNPRLGSPLMTSRQTAGIDLPIKALAWQDEVGQVWLSYNDPAYIARRHGIAHRADIIRKMSGALAKFSRLAAAP